MHLLKIAISFLMNLDCSHLDHVTVRNVQWLSLKPFGERRNDQYWWGPDQREGSESPEVQN